MTESAYNKPDDAILKMKLQKPITIKGEEVGEIFIRSPNLQDISDAGLPLHIDDEGTTIFDEVNAAKMLARLSNVPLQSLAKMHAADAMACFYGMRPFFLLAEMPTLLESTI